MWLSFSFRCKNKHYCLIVNNILVKIFDKAFPVVVSMVIPLNRYFFRAPLLIRICLSDPGGQSEYYRTGGFQIPRLKNLRIANPEERRVSS